MKFSIRDLLLVTVIMALALGWAVERTKLTREIVTLESKMEPCIAINGGVVTVTGYRERKMDWLDRLELIFRSPTLSTP